ncbi:ComEA family DNA-binding protein [Haliscomenobacter sp.]|uniref:ComEA family DNA-binding protein n=1 Tax=Haliscomenobacter sp. TaxID=2717303 RepID=UPI003BAC6D38
MRSILILPFLLMVSLLSIAQRPDSIIVDPVPTDLLEDFLQNSGAESGDFDLNGQFDLLATFQKRPLNINRCDEADLRELGLLNDIQINNLLQYRKTAGPLLALYELQVIPGFDLALIRRIIPYLTTGGDLDDFQASILEMIGDGRNEAQMRWSRVLEKQAGYANPESDQSYRGDPNQLFVRWRHTYYNRLSFGITAEKDRGEAFFKENNRQGFDFYSAHFFLNNYRKKLKALALGDFNASFGQGLILFSGFSTGKNAASTLVKRNARNLRPYASANEANYLRGVGISYALSDKLEATAFYSSRLRDGNVNGVDTLDEEVASFSSFIDAGFHRTAREIEDKNSVRQNISGLSLQYHSGSYRLGINSVYHRFDRALTLNPQPYNRFYFQGQSLFNTSVDYSARWGNLNAFGETAWSDNGAISTLNGLLMTLDRKMDAALVYRRYPRNFQALGAAAFGETDGGRNEEGMYMGLEVRPRTGWTVNAYYDVWRHPWLRFQVDAPSRGTEWRLRLTYEKRRRMRAFVELRQENKEENAFGNETAYNVLAPTRLIQLRTYISNQVSKAMELRTRADWGYWDDGVGAKEFGFAVLQDVIVQPIGFPLSFNTRFALFDTDSYNVRFYYYENDLLNTFSIPPYYNRGSRVYLNLRYRPVSALTIEARFAQTFWSNQTEIGSGLELINGPRRTQLSAQIKYVF